MSRRQRRLWTALTAASLVASAGCAALWVRSYLRADVLAYVARPEPDRFWRFEVSAVVGLFACDLSVVELDLPGLDEVPVELANLGWQATSRPYGRREMRSQLSFKRAYRLLDFTADHEPRIQGLADDGPAVRWERWSLTVPWWALVLGFATPFLWGVRQRRAARAQAAAAAADATTTPAGPVKAG